MNTSCQKQASHTPSVINAENCRHFKGVHLRKWGKWVSEVRIPKCRAKIWLGSYDTAEQAARAYDAAIYCLRGHNAKFNFPNSIPVVPSASSLSRHQIQIAAAKYALGQIPSSTKNNTSVLIAQPALPSTSSFLSQMEASSDTQPISEELHFALWESLLWDSDSNQFFSILDEIPLLNDAALELTSPTGEMESTSYDPFHFWSF